MKPMAQLIAGFIIFMAGLWGGSWLLEIFPQGSTYNFAAFVTMIIMMAGGMAIGAKGFVEGYA